MTAVNASIARPDPDNPGKTFDQSRDELLRVGFAPDAVYNGAYYGGQDAETLWNNLVKHHPNISLVLSGHQYEDFDDFKYHLESGVYGNQVYELLVDPQNMAAGGNGWIRLLEFDADGTTVHVKTYSPYLNQWDTSPDTFYDITLSPIIAGDFDSDGDVDGGDFLVWQRGGSPNPLSAADLAIWQQSYAAPQLLTGNVVVPEPVTQLLMVSGGLVMYLPRRRSIAELLLPRQVTQLDALDTICLRHDSV